MNLKTGHLLKRGDYRVEKVLGQGGFGITYLAEQTALLRKVAVKEFFMREYCEREHDTASITLGSSGSRDMVDRFRQKFIKEARVLATLNHKHIVRIIDVFEENNTAYYVMEYVGGGSLNDKVKEDALSEDEAVRYIRQVATALEFVHSQHMMHLDIKPSNILLNENDEAVLIDFGLAKQYDATGSQTSTTPVGISHGYAPLEQYRQGGVETFSPATDIYSLGATLYKLLTGITPVEAPLRAGGENMSPLSDEITPSTATAIEKSMQLAIANRPQSIGEFLSLLDGNVEPTVDANQSGKPDDGATVVASISTPGSEVAGGCVISSENENLCSTQNDKERVISTNAGETVLLTDDELSPSLRRTSNKVAQGVEERNRSFNKKLITIISVAAICIIAVFFGVKSCNDRKAAEAEAQHATAIAEQQRIEAERKAQERADCIAEQQRLEEELIAQEAAEKAEQERIAKEAAEKKRKEEERKAKEEADRLAAEKKREEEEKCKRQEAAKRSHGTINGHEWVDLGLSVKWATCNVGASKPEDYGGYYAWGETKEKSDYSWSTYKWCKGSSNTMVKYCTNGRCGTVDNKTVLEPQDDVAHVKWGGTWRMPTSDELDELRKKCKWEWTTINRVNGYKVTGANGNSIFLPAADYRDGAVANDRGCYGGYWSSSLSSSSNYAYRLYFSNSGCDWGSLARFGGRSVRPVSKLRESYD